VAPRIAARGQVAPPRAEHGLANDVEAGRMMAGTAAKPVSDAPDPGKPVELPPHGQCRFDISLSPNRLMAGQTGLAKIVMVLEGDSVVESAANLRIVLPEGHDPAQSLLALGPGTILPPQPASLAPAYRGRLVYDNCAVVELPITMSSVAPSGSLQSIEIEARFRLHEGSTGRLFGEFRNPLLITCEVGSVADPAIQGTSTDAGTATAVPVAGTPASSPAEPSRPEETGADGGTAPDLANAPSDRGALLLIVTGGLLVIAVFTVVARRR
jgi:hypothetical protein